MPLEQPKKPVGGAYGVYLAKHRAEFAVATKGQKASAISKLAGEGWKKLGQKEREPYEKQYLVVKDKYEKDMKAFLDSGGQKQPSARALKRKEKEEGGGGKRRKLAKDPNRPKRPAGGAYGVFLNKNRQAFQKECPGSSITGVAKLASKKWAALPADQKKPYEMEFQKLQAAYRKAMETYVPPANNAGGKAEEEGDEEDGEEEEEEA